MLKTRLILALITGAIAIISHLAGYSAVGYWLVTAVAIFALTPNAREMVHTLRNGGFGVDVLALSAVGTALLLGEDLTAIVIVIMMLTGEALEEFAQHRARAELSALFDRAPKLAHVQRGHHIEDMPVDALRPGDEIQVRPGEIVPVDCSVTQGQPTLDESAITGESLPVDKTVGDEILSGTVNLHSPFTATALRTSHNSQYAQIIALVQDAASRRSPLVRLADQYSLPFTAISYAIAGAAWGTSHNPMTALEVLVVATPCPLLIAAPVAIVAGMSRSAASGIILKSGGALELLARLRTVAFDKTGTLTAGRPEVAGVHPATGFTEEQVLGAAAALDHTSTHILAQAIVTEAARRAIKLPHITNMHEDHGQGARAHTGGRVVMVGRATYLAAAGITLPGTAAHDQTSTYVAIGQRYAGSITFSDQVRPETPGVLRDLRALGITHTLMLTGDREPVARAVAHHLGITDIQAECLPATKVAAIEALPPVRRPVAMVGDGVNDAPTLAASDVGIALGAKGSTAASQSADVVIMLDDLGRVPTAIHIARQSIHIARQSILVGIGLSIILMLIAATGIIPPIIGAILQEAVDVAVIVNALRAHRG